MAFAIDWPGWSRGAKTPAEALATLDSYRRRYCPVALAAVMGDEFEAAGPLEVIQEQVGTGSTDFWGISFSPSDTEQDPMSDTEFDRKINLLRACWALFDMVAVRVSPDMRKGPHGGGRDRDTIISHTIQTESENFAKRVGLRIPEGGALTPDGFVHREAYVAAMRSYNSGECSSRKRTATGVPRTSVCAPAATAWACLVAPSVKPPLAKAGRVVAMRHSMLVAAAPVDAMRSSAIARERLVFVA